MRIQLLLVGLAIGLVLTGCDSVGVDGSGQCATCGPNGGHGHEGGGDKGDDASGGGDTSGSDTGGGDTGGGDTGGGDTGGSSRFIPVDPRQTYLRTSKDDALDAPAVRLEDYKIFPGDSLCLTAVGDYTTEPGALATARDYPLVTAIFSGSDSLLDKDQRVRVKAALDAGEDVGTLQTAYDLLETDVDEDFDATNACVVVPDGAAFLFVSAYDAFYADNSDALAAGQAFGLVIN